MLERQVERCCSSETRREIVVQESMHGEIEQVSSTDAQIRVSLADSQEIQEADLPSQSVSDDCIGADSSVMQSHLLMPTSIQCLDDINDMLVRDIHIDACTPQMGDSYGTIDCLDK